MLLVSYTCVVISNARIVDKSARRKTPSCAYFFCFFFLFEAVRDILPDVKYCLSAYNGTNFDT